MDEESKTYRFAQRLLTLVVILVVVLIIMYGNIDRLNKQVNHLQAKLVLIDDAAKELYTSVDTAQWDVSRLEQKLSGEEDSNFTTSFYIEDAYNYLGAALDIVENEILARTNTY